MCFVLIFVSLFFLDRYAGIEFWHSRRRHHSKGENKMSSKKKMSQMHQKEYKHMKGHVLATNSKKNTTHGQHL